MDKTRFENLEKKIAELTKLLRHQLLMGDWIPREAIKHFFNYGDTQIKNLSKDPMIITSKVKNRVFFSRDSVIAFLEEHKKKD